MSKYYQVLFDDECVYGVAYLTSEKMGGSCFPPPGIFVLPYAGSVADWKVLALELREGEFADYLSSNLGCRLCSDRLKGILQSSASSDDLFQWLPVEVHKGDDNHSYWVLHFPNPPDVLNRDRSIFAGDAVVKPVFSGEAIGAHQVFSYPEAGNLPLFVSESIKRVIEAAGCTGMELSQAPVR